jgi:arylformamidase
MKCIDLTLTISKDLPMFPGSPTPNFIQWSSLKEDGYNLELVFLSSHSGTHIDAPFHFTKNGTKIHKISPDRLVVDAILIKIKKGKKIITREDIEDFEKKNFLISKNSTIIFHTDWSKNLNKNFYFTKNPGLSLSAAKYLASKKINLVGIDSPSIDLGSDEKFPAHHILSKNDILIVENLINLEKIHTPNFRLVILPLKLKNATGSPVRALAIT